MNGLVDQLSPLSIWLVDYLLLASVLLVCVLATLAALAQPVRRLAVTKSALVALALSALLCALPGWSVVHLLTNDRPAEARRTATAAPAPATAPTEFIAPPGDLELTPLAPSPQRVPAAPMPPKSRTWSDIPWLKIAQSSYAVGSTLVLLWLIIGAIAARRLRRCSSSAPQELIDLFRKVAGNPPQLPELVVSDKTETAIALGIRQPIVVLPREWTTRQSPQDLASVLSHEWAHIKNGDLLWLGISRALFVQLWIQPFFWLLRRRMRLDQEALADAAAADTTSRPQYAAELVAWARATTGRPRMSAAAAVGLWEGPSQLRQRIAILLDERFTVLRRCSRRWQLSAAISLVTVATVLSLVTVQPQSLGQTGQNETAAATKQNGATGQQMPESKPTLPEQNRIELMRFFAEGLTPVQRKQLSDVPPAEFEVELAKMHAATKAANADDKGSAVRVPQPFQSQPNTILGRCVDENGKPLANVELAMYRLDTTGGNHEILNRTTSDADGNFTFKPAIEIARFYPNGMPPREEGLVVSDREPFVVVTVRLAGRASARMQFPVPELIKNGYPVTSTLKPAAALRGRITDPGGKPVADALVSVGTGMNYGPVGEASTTRTDANGNYEINDLAAFDAAELARQRAALTQGRRGGERPVGQPANGTLSLPSPPLVYVNHPRFARKTSQAGSVPGTKDIQLELPASIASRVVYGDTDRPAAGLTVHIARSRLSQAEALLMPAEASLLLDVQNWTTKTAGDGRYSMTNLPPGQYDIWVDSDEWVHQGISRFGISGRFSTDFIPNNLPPGQYDFWGDSEGERAPEIKLTKGGTIRVQFVDAATDQPIALPGETTGELALIWQDEKNRPSRRYIEQRPGKVSVDGRMEIHQYAGEFMVAMTRLNQTGQPAWQQPRNESKTITVKDGETTELRVSLTKASSQPRGGAAPRGLRTGGRPSTQPAAEQKEQDPNSKEAAPAAAAPSSPNTSSAAAQSAPAPAAPRSVQLEPNVIFGTCFDETGQPLAGVELTLYSVSQILKTSEHLGQTKSDASGRYEFRQAVKDAKKIFPDGKVPTDKTQNYETPLLAITARLPGRASTRGEWPAHMVITYGLSASLSLRPAATLRGRITDPTGWPVNGAVVTVGSQMDRLSEGAPTARTDGNGEYSLNDLFANDPTTNRSQTFYEFMLVQHPNFARKLTNAGKIPGTKDVQLELPARVAGRVVYGESGRRAGGIVVHIATSDPSQAENLLMSDADRRTVAAQNWGAVVTSADGSYAMNNLPAGKYDIWIDNPEWVHPGIDRFAVSPSENPTCPEIKLTKGGRIRMQLVDAATDQRIPITGDEVGEVHAIPSDQAGRLNGKNFSFVRKAKVSPDGRLEINQYPGEFTTRGAAVFQNAELTWTSKDTTVRSLTIKEGETIDLRLQMVKPAPRQPNPAPRGRRGGAQPATRGAADDKSAASQPEQVSSREADPRELNVALNEQGLVPPFNFQGQSWPAVLEWYAKLANSAWDWQELPNERVNLVTQRAYELAEVRNLLNRMLLARGYTMLQRDRVVSVFKLENLHSSQVEQVPESELASRMPYDVVKATFALPKDTNVDQVTERLKAVLNPKARIIPLVGTHQVQVIDAAANLVTVSEMLQKKQEPEVKE